MQVLFKDFMVLWNYYSVREAFDVKWKSLELFFSSVYLCWIEGFEICKICKAQIAARFQFLSWHLNHTDNLNFKAKIHVLKSFSCV